MRVTLLVGGSGNDDLRGDFRLAADQTLGVDGSADILIGGTGNDQLYGGGGDDEMQGDEGSDIFEGQQVNDVQYGGPGIDVFVLWTEKDPTTGAFDEDEIHGDRINATTPANAQFADILSIDGTDQDDTILLSQEDVPAGRTPRLRVDYNNRDENFRDPIFVKVLDDDGKPLVEQFSIAGLAGNDTIGFITQHAKDHVLDGNFVQVPLDLTPFANSTNMVGDLQGNSGDDLLIGSPGRDHIDGGPGSDTMFGFGGDDRLWGDLGGGSANDEDVLFAGQGRDDLIGGQGTNQLFAWSIDPRLETTETDNTNFGVFVDGDGMLHSTPGANRTLEETGLNRLLGGERADELYGGTVVDFMYGNGGNDTLFRADGSEFESLDDNQVEDDSWKEYARESDHVWYVGGTNANDTVQVGFATTGKFAGRHFVKVQEDDGDENFMEFLDTPLDFTNWKAAELPDLDRLLGTTDPELRSSILDNFGAETRDSLINAVLPPERDFLVILVDTLAGNDEVTVSPTVQKTVWIDAGAGDDTVEIRSGNAILVDKAESGPNGRNDEPSQAFALDAVASTAESELVYTGLTIDNREDVDWFRFTLLGDLDRDAVTIANNSPLAAFTLEFFDPTDNAKNEAALLAAGEHLLKVSNNIVPAIYDLHFDLADTSDADVTTIDLGLRSDFVRRDVIVGGPGNDRLRGGPGEDWIFGNDGNDVLTGGKDTNASDLLFGGKGDDTFQLIPDDLPAVPGNLVEQMIGGEGNDRVLYLGQGQDSADAERDFVALRYNTALHQYEFTSLVWNASEDAFVIDKDGRFVQRDVHYQTRDVEESHFDLRGGDDVFYSSYARSESGHPIFKVSDPRVLESRMFTEEWGIQLGDFEQGATNGGLTINGGQGKDAIFGGALDDTINGGAGDDFIVGYTGNDRLRGGTGEDDLFGFCLPFHGGECSDTDSGIVADGGERGERGERVERVERVEISVLYKRLFADPPEFNGSARRSSLPVDIGPLTNNNPGNDAFRLGDAVPNPTGLRGTSLNDLIDEKSEFSLIQNQAFGLDSDGARLTNLRQAGDVNGDGEVDFLVTKIGQEERRDHLLLGPLDLNGRRSIDDYTYDLFVPEELVGGGIGDVNGDGRDDLVAAVAGSNAIRVYYWNEAHLKNTVEFEIPFRSEAASTEILDFNGDGHADILVTPDSRQGTPAGQFQAGVIYSGAEIFEASNLVEQDSFVFDSAAGPLSFILSASDTVDLRATVAGDVNGDGLDDILFNGYEVIVGSNQFSGSILPGRRTDEFSTPFLMGIDQPAPMGIPVALGDLDSDGFDDFGVITDFGLEYRFGNSDFSQVFEGSRLIALDDVTTLDYGTAEGLGFASIENDPGGVISLSIATSANSEPISILTVAANSLALGDSLDANGDGFDDIILEVDNRILFIDGPIVEIDVDNIATNEIHSDGVLANDSVGGRSVLQDRARGPILFGGADGFAFDGSSSVWFQYDTLGDGKGGDSLELIGEGIVGSLYDDAGRLLAHDQVIFDLRIYEAGRFFLQVNSTVGERFHIEVDPPAAGSTHESTRLPDRDDIQGGDGIDFIFGNQDRDRVEFVAGPEAARDRLFFDYLDIVLGVPAVDRRQDDAQPATDDRLEPINPTIQIVDQNLAIEMAKAAGRPVTFGDGDHPVFRELLATDVTPLTELELNGRPVGDLTGIDRAVNLQTLNLSTQDVEERAVDLRAVEDTYVWEHSRSADHGNTADLLSIGFPTLQSIPLVRFNLDHLIGQKVDGDGQFELTLVGAHASHSAISAQLFEVRPDWTESSSWESIEFGDDPLPFLGVPIGSGPEVIMYDRNGTQEQEFTFTIPRNVLQRWLSDPDSNNGLAIFNSEEAPAQDVRFGSSESGNGPRLRFSVESPVSLQNDDLELLSPRVAQGGSQANETLGLPKLEELNLSGNEGITNISALRGLSELRSLNLTRTGVEPTDETIDVLRSLTKVEELFLDVSPAIRSTGRSSFALDQGQRFSVLSAQDGPYRVLNDDGEVFHASDDAFEVNFPTDQPGVYRVQLQGDNGVFENWFPVFVRNLLPELQDFSIAPSLNQGDRLLVSSIPFRIGANTEAFDINRNGQRIGRVIATDAGSDPLSIRATLTDPLGRKTIVSQPSEYHFTLPESSTMMLPASVLDGAEDVSIAFSLRTQKAARQVILDVTGDEGNSFRSSFRVTVNGDALEVWESPGATIEFNTPTFRFSLGSSIADDEVHEFVIVRRTSSGAVEAFMDGQSLGSQDATLDPIDVLGTGNFSGIQFGNTLFSPFIVPEVQLEGTLGEVAIWRRAISTDEVTVLRAQGVDNTDRTLAGYWPLNDGFGNVATDISVNGRDGTLIQAPGFRAAVHNDQPVATWRLDDAESTLASGASVEEVGGRFNGLTVGAGIKHDAPPSPARVPLNLNMDFDGTNYVEVPFAPDLNPQGSFSVELWARVDGGQGSFRSAITSRDAAPGPELGYIIYAGSDNQWQFWTGQGSGFHDLKGPAVERGKWTHLVATFDTGGAQADGNGVFTGVASLFVDGDLAATNAGVRYKPTTSHPLRIGAGASESTSAQFFFNGALDEVGIYDRALTQEQVNSHLAASAPLGWRITQSDFDGVDLTLSGEYFLDVEVTDVDGGSVTSQQRFTVQDVPPQVAIIDQRAGTPKNVAGEPIPLLAQVVDPGGDESSLFWEVTTSNGDVVRSADDETFEFTPQFAGEYVVTLTSIGSGDIEDVSATETFTVLPSVTIERITTVDLFSLVQLQAGEVSPLAVPAERGTADVTRTFVWEVFLLGSQKIAEGEGPEFDFVPTQPNDYSVVLSVSDIFEAPGAEPVSFKNSVVVAIRADSSDTPTISGPAIVAEGRTAAFAIDGLPDLPPEASASRRFEWTVGRPFSSTTETIPTQTPTLDFQSIETSPYSLNVRVIDTYGSASNIVFVDAHDFEVINIAPVVNSGGDRAAAVGEELVINAEISDVDSGLTYAVNWGDGSPEESGDVAGDERTLRHTFREPGEYTVTVSASDGEDTRFEPITVLVTAIEEASTDPSIPGDANGDGVVDTADIDAIRNGSGRDLNGDGQLDESDVRLVLIAADTRPGDANFDGTVNVRDFLLVSRNFNEVSTWAGGDFDGDGVTNVRDFLAVSRNFNKSGALPPAGAATLGDLEMDVAAVAAAALVENSDPEEDLWVFEESITEVSHSVSQSRRRR